MISVTRSAESTMSSANAAVCFGLAAGTYMYRGASLRVTVNYTV